MEFALNFLKSNAGIDGPALLSSPFLVVTLGLYGHRRGYRMAAEESQRLLRWVLIANAKGRYSRGSSETLLDQDLATLRQDGGADELLERLNLQVGRLDVTKAAGSAAGASDWNSNLAIALSHRGAQHKLQFHHVFPKAVLKASYTSREADDIANLAFIGGKTNRQISDRPPASYFPQLIERSGSATFEAQCIPVDPALLTVTGYLDFLSRRRQLISARLNEFMGVGNQ